MNTATVESIAWIARSEIGRVIPSPTRGAVELVVRVQHDAVEDVAVDVYDVLGRRVRQIARTRLGSGEYRLRWDGRDEGGRTVATGTYFFRARIGKLVGTRKALVLH